MITNDRQYKITKASLEKFQRALKDLREGKNDNVHPRLVEAQEAALQSQYNDLERELLEYEDLKNGKTVISSVSEIRDLPVSLIKARIANNLTQSELASKLGLKMQQIQRYENEMYDTANLKTLEKIAQALGISLTGEIQLKTIEVISNYDIKDYPFKEMYQRKWFGNYSGTYNDAVLEGGNLLARFFEKPSRRTTTVALNKQSVRHGSEINSYALQAWYNEILVKAEAINTERFSKSILDPDWFRDLALLSDSATGPKEAIKFLNQAGITVVIEKQLTGTFLDGAAFLKSDLTPIVAMTLRHDRLDNFWFVLFHELAHILLHLSPSLDAIFDDLDIPEKGIEEEADNFALNALIPETVWKKSLVRFNPSKEIIVAQAKALKIHPALVAGRIRHETRKYFLFSDLVGQGEVRKLFNQ